MASSILQIPEMMALDSRRNLIRIPPELDVPLTTRMRRLIDTAAFRRLHRISQLGLVSLVYPAAQHSRFEHSLGVYRLALHVLRHLAHQPEFTAQVDTRAATRFMLAALLHDIGHWPFAHIIEDLQLPGVPHHEAVAEHHLRSPEVAQILRNDFDTTPEDVATLLCHHGHDPQEYQTSLLYSILSGPIDVDKMDYLMRDSLHAGVPYGRNYDQPRLLASLCLNATHDGLALSEKGRTAAEMLVFARYVMFSEVYWNHAVRAATAMFQRSIYRLSQTMPIAKLVVKSDQEAIIRLRHEARGTSSARLLSGLFGKRRRLYKRVSQYSAFEQNELYFQLARRSYTWTESFCTRFAELASSALGETIPTDAILLDVPPCRRETEVRIDLFYPKEQKYRRLEDVSPIIQTFVRSQPIPPLNPNSRLITTSPPTLIPQNATETKTIRCITESAHAYRFDDYVKRVRLFADPLYVPRLRRLPQLADLVWQAASECDRGM